MTNPFIRIKNQYFWAYHVLNKNDLLIVEKSTYTGNRIFWCVHGNCETYSENDFEILEEITRKPNENSDQ